MIIKRSVPWHARSALSRSAHVIARIGLALTGTACGLFVAQVSAHIDLVGSVEAMLAMMLYGAAGFYLGIDLPQIPSDHHMHLPPRRGLGTSADMLELLTAAGIFLTAVAAVVSRDCNIESPASPYAIMRRVHPYRGENSGPGKDDRWRT
jgi:hypothetical protein